MNNVAQNGEKSIVGAIKIDKKEVQEHMDKLVRGNRPAWYILKTG